jgi:hypothetical protein
MPKTQKAPKKARRKKNKLFHKLKGRARFLGYWTAQHTLPKGVRARLRRNAVPDAALEDRDEHSTPT